MFKKFLKGLIRLPFRFKKWRTIKLGLHRNADDTRRALETAGCRVSERAEEIFDCVPFFFKGKKVDLVICSVADLGFADSATLAQIYEAAQKFGLLLCPAEVGPALREQYCDQPMGDFPVIAMKSIAGSNGHPMLFLVERNEYGFWLHTCYGHEEFVWHATCCFVFMLGK